MKSQSWFVVPQGSSAISHWRYHKGKLDVRFLNGTEYRYSEVPKAVIDQLLQAPSFGIAYLDVVRGQFNSKRIKGSITWELT